MATYTIRRRATFVETYVVPGVDTEAEAFDVIWSGLLDPVDSEDQGDGEYDVDSIERDEDTEDTAEDGEDGEEYADGVRMARTHRLTGSGYHGATYYAAAAESQDPAAFARGYAAGYDSHETVR